MSAWLARLMLCGRGASLPVARTGERELDRIIDALNDARERFAAARRESEALAAEVAAAERLAGLGRVVAGVAHEIRNTRSRMRSQAMMRAAARRSPTPWNTRLDGLVAELLAMTQRR
ncbi:MAG: sensor histidine kinase, partial [Alphaproteobacteria bacterium]|nr:sensor histidine kinase [Alphaproteobacteria bacterium]